MNESTQDRHETRVVMRVTGFTRSILLGKHQGFILVESVCLPIALLFGVTDSPRSRSILGLIPSGTQATRCPPLIDAARAGPEVEGAIGSPSRRENPIARSSLPLSSPRLIVFSSRFDVFPNLERKSPYFSHADELVQQDAEKTPIEKFGFIFQRNSHGSMREKLKMSERSRDRENEGGRDKERDWDREKERDSSRLGRKERGQDREKERNRDRRRDYERGRITNDERGRDKFDEWDRFHNRDNDRQKFDIEKEKRHKHRSRSRSKDRFSKRTKSRSPSPSKSPILMFVPWSNEVTRQTLRRSLWHPVEAR
ncbi:hypothetical protein C4D60_Mb01t12320 [Musa balbisiana]|uniref:Uncharacterized protein n=1 Tax=Musa balbisiana TaxID=52838 RepID=A0A4S8JNQ5_MUSBA|nr:hypothetical protein C4D60_Mb01t12320 [Musa balbisiana]